MATKNDIGSTRDLGSCVSSAHFRFCTLQGVLALPEDPDITAQLGHRRNDDDPDSFVKFMAIKAAFAATLNALEVDLDEASHAVMNR